MASNIHRNLGRLLLLLSCVTLAACQKAKPETLIESGYDEQEMNAAIAKARSDVDSFIAVLEKGDGEDFAVKAPITDGDQTEHFWINAIVFRNGAFEGTINNEPGIVSNVKIGQKWTIAKGEISDWMYMRDGKMYGNYTMRPLLKTMPEDQAAALRSLLAEP